VIQELIEQRAALKARLEALHKNAVNEAGEARSLNTEESAEFDTGIAELRSRDERINELQVAEKREAAAAAHRVEIGEKIPTSSTKVTDPAVYARSNIGQSFFRDLYTSRMTGDSAAGERLERHRRMVGDEQRALGNTNTTGGSGGELAPPTWLVEDFVALVRPGRATAQLYKQMPVPAGTASINIPKILTGTTVALQSTQNTALSQTDLTTGSVGTGFSTIGGKQIVSQQLLDQSAIPFDRVVTEDLAAAWSLNFGTQVVSGAGTGANNNSVVNGLANAAVLAGNQTVWTQATPTAAGFYGRCANMVSQFATTRYAEPNVWLMHPRRWYWLLAQSDTAGRPLVVPDAQLASNTVQAFNPIAVNSGSPVQVVGAVGMFLGLPVVIDPLLPTNLGAGTNQDEVFLLKSDDLWLYESAPVADVFRGPYADSMGVLFRLYSYVGVILNRQSASIATLNGTGLVTPVFPS
jgi:HK97 family phage major capsid protein